MDTHYYDYEVEAAYMPSNEDKEKYMSLPLAAGTYRLTDSVKNPRPDRRANQSRLSSWEAWETWPKDMLFIVEIDREFPILNRIKPQGGIGHMTRHDAGFLSLIECLELIEEKPSDLILRRGSGLTQHYALGILDRLGVPVEEIARIMEEMDNESEQES